MVGSRKMHLLCTGERRAGEPLILLEAGMGSWSFYWRLVQPELSQVARVCSYDRFGFGWSDPVKESRTPQGIASELYQALQNAGEPGPYLLVGHSFGGILARQFARLYPEEVFGMVSFLSKSIRPVWQFAFVFLVFFLANAGVEWVRNTEFWQNNFEMSGVAYVKFFLPFHALDILRTFLVITALWFVKRNRAVFFLTKGQTDAPIEPVPWLGKSSPNRGQGTGASGQ